jgi:hypothetical protein
MNQTTRLSNSSDIVHPRYLGPLLLFRASRSPMQRHRQSQFCETCPIPLVIRADERRREKAVRQSNPRPKRRFRPWVCAGVASGLKYAPNRRQRRVAFGQPKRRCDLRVNEYAAYSKSRRSDASKMKATSVGVGRTRGVNSSHRLRNDRETVWYAVTPAGSLQAGVIVTPKRQNSCSRKNRLSASS